MLERLVLTYGRIPAHSPAANTADPAHAPAEDILGWPRTGGGPDIGAYENRADHFAYVPVVFK